MEDSIEYIFTYPGGWAEQRSLYFRAIEHAGLVPIEFQGQHRVHLMTEGEVGLHFCISLLGGDTFNHAARQGIVVIDAGGGIINLSMFLMTSNLSSCEEIAPAECMQSLSIAKLSLIHPYLLSSIGGLCLYYSQS